MKRVEAALRTIIKNPLEAIGYTLAGSLVLIGLYLLSPLFAEGTNPDVSRLAVHAIGLGYLITGIPFILRKWRRLWPRWLRGVTTNFLFMGHLFTLLFILISVGLRPPHFMWSLACVISALVVHLWVGVHTNA